MRFVQKAGCMRGRRRECVTLPETTEEKKKQKSDFLCSIAAEPVLENWVEGKHRYIYRSMNVVGG